MALEITLKDQNILVTGAASGIGLSLCQTLHSQGAHVFALDVNQEQLSELERECPGIQTTCVDLQDWDATRKAVSALGRMDGLVNNAGIGIDGKFLDTKPENFDKVMNINVKAIINCSQVVCQGMIDSGKGGNIVHVSSLAARLGTRASIPYNLSKAALDILTKSMALELGPSNIRVNSVNPNIVLTELARQWMKSSDGEALKTRLISRTPLGRIAEIHEVVNTIIFLLSDAAPMIHGENVLIDGGYSAY